MPTTPVTIDLGQVPPAGQTPVEAQWSGSWRPWARRQRWRAWAAAAVAAMSLLTTTAAAAPRPPWAAVQFTVPAGDIAVGRDQFYVIDSDDAGRQTLTARRSEDGAATWEVTARGPNSWFVVQGGVPLEVRMQLVESDEGNTSYPFTIVRKPDTGGMRWARDGYVAMVGGGELAVVEDVSGPPAVVDTATGREIWRLPPARTWGYEWLSPGDARQLAVLTRDGELISYDLATGEVLARTTEAVPPDGAMIEIVDPLVLMVKSGPAFEELTITAYDVNTLRHRWTASPAGGGWSTYGCGAQLCVLGAPRPYALDPATGNLAWAADWLPDDTPVIELLPTRTDLVLASGWILDSTTGDPILELADWQLQPSSWPPSTDAPLLTRYERSTERGAMGRTWFGRLHGSPPRVEVLGSLPGRLTGCQLTAERLACSQGEQLHVWRIRLP